MKDKNSENSKIFEDKDFVSFIHTYYKVRNKFKQLPKETIHSFFDEILVPLLVFIPQLGCLESIVKYLKENLGLSYAKISDGLGRSEINIKITYSNSKKKFPELFVVEEVSGKSAGSAVVPLKIFKSKELGMLECLVKFLKEDFNLKFSEIAKLLHRDQRTIWTVYHRVISKEKKCSASKKKKISGSTKKSRQRTATGGGKK